MKTLIFSLIAVVVLTAVAATSPAPIKADDISGNYTGVARTDSIGDIPVTLTLKSTDGKITGTLDSPQGQGEIRDGSLTKGKFTCVLDFQGSLGSISATVDGDKLTGTWDVAGLSGTLEVKKVAAKAGSSL
ncbi:MAG: hypothetical protein ABJB40_10390 [Acidobacteriota bacterium]